MGLPGWWGTTSFTFNLVPIPELTLFNVTWSYEAAADVLGSWFGWIRGAPDELWSDCLLIVPGSGAGPECILFGVFCGPPSACSAALQPLLGAIRTAPRAQSINPSDYLEAMLSIGGCEGKSVAACHLPSQNPAGTLSRSTFVAKSAFLDAALADGAIQDCVSAVQHLAGLGHEIGGGIVFDSLGGAVASVGGDQTAFVHRQALCDVQYDANWPPGTPADVVAQITDWLGTTQAILAPLSAGSYVNYIDPTLPDFLTAYYGSNLPRLERVKRAVDPEDVFHFDQSIPPG